MLMDVRWAAFLDELEKIAAATKPVREVRHARWSVKKHRTGRRPISVDNLLKKEKDGSLLKAAQLMMNVVEFPVGGQNPSAARPPRKKGDPPSLEDFEIRKGGDTGVNASVPLPITGSSTITRT
jgi:hypothetical protein